MPSVCFTYSVCHLAAALWTYCAGYALNKLLELKMHLYNIYYEHLYNFLLKHLFIQAIPKKLIMDKQSYLT